MPWCPGQLAVRGRLKGELTAHQHHPAAVLAVSDGGLADEELRLAVEGEDVVVLVLADLLRLVPALGPAVAHDNVDAAHVALRLLEETRDLGEARDVCADGDGAGAGGLVGRLGGADLADAMDLVDDGLRRVGGARVVDDDAGAAAGELEGAAATDSA